MAVADNLLLGPATLYVAPFGTALPDDGDVAALAAGSLTGWTAVGETAAAVTLKDAPQYVRANSQQRARAVDVFVSEITTTVESTAMEMTLARLADVVRGTSTTAAGVTTVTPTTIGPVPKFSLALLGPWPGGTALFVAERCAFVDGQDVSWDSGKVTEVPFKVEVLSGDDLGDAGYSIYVIAA